VEKAEPVEVSLIHTALNGPLEYVNHQASVRAASHMRLRVRVHYCPSNTLLLVEKAEPVQVPLLHKTLEGPMEYVDYRALLRATSHTRLRARDHYWPSSTLSLVEKVELVQVSLLHTALEGPMECVCGCKMTDVVSAWIPTWH
jgi:hypothetical protein